MDFAYLGVHTSRLDNGLSHQLGLPLGAHLKVERVATGSPAEDAGIKLFDINFVFERHYSQKVINFDAISTEIKYYNFLMCGLIYQTVNSTILSLIAFFCPHQSFFFGSENFRLKRG